MAYYRRWAKKVSTINYRCSSCQNEGNAGVFKRRTIVLFFFFIPVWYRKQYYITCGHCFNNFKLDKRRGSELEKGAEFEARRPPTPSPPGPESAGVCCQNCGIRLQRGARFCEQCGRPA